MLIFLIALICLIMFFQDNKYRGISWYLFPALFVSALFYSSNYTFNILIGNILIFSIILAFMTLYLSLKFKKIILITNNFFSIGDVLFLIAVSPFFTHLSYVVFINVGTLLTLLIYFLFQKKQHQKNIPFAGNMALVLIFLIILFHE